MTEARKIMFVALGKGNKLQGKKNKKEGRVTRKGTDMSRETIGTIVN